MFTFTLAFAIFISITLALDMDVPSLNNAVAVNSTRTGLSNLVDKGEKAANKAKDAGKKSSQYFDKTNREERRSARYRFDSGHHQTSRTARFRPACDCAVRVKSHEELLLVFCCYLCHCAFDTILIYYLII